MVRLNTVSKDKVFAALLLLACLGAGMPAWGKSPQLNNPIGNISVSEDDPDNSFDLSSVFNDGDNPTTYSIDTNSDPALVNATITGNTLTLSYAPDGSGSSTLIIRATDFDGEFADDKFQVDVTAVNDPPVAVGQAIATSEDTSAAVVLAATDVENDALTFAVVSPPSRGILSGTAPNLTYTPNLDANGPDSFSFAASDATDTSAAVTVSIDVGAINDVPVFTAPLPDMNLPEDAPPFTIDLNAYVSDVDIATNGDTLTYNVINSNPALVTTSFSGADLTLTLAGNLFGTADLTVEARDSAGALVSDTFTLTVASVDDVPIAVDDNVVMNEDGGSLVINVLANDISGDNPTTVISAGTTVSINGIDYPDSSESVPTTVRDSTGTDVTLPNGTLVISANSVSYTPKADFHGTDFFTYTIRDGDGQTAMATVTILVNSVADAPSQAGSLAYTVVQASFLSIQAAGGMASQGFDPDGDIITVVQDTVPTSRLAGYVGTTLSVSPDGSFSYTPDVTFVGTDSFVIRLTDGVTFSAPIVVTVEVTPAPPPPPPAPPGEVEFDFDLANVPLEDAVSAEANVLVIMDDSGSMDWALMTDGAEGQFWLTNAGRKSNETTTSTREWRYLYPLASNVYGNDRVLPTEAAIAADAAFLGNDYGVWRGRNAQFNTMYYNPAINYRPWVGLDRSSVEFDDVLPTAAPLDPYEAPIRTLDLTAPITYVSNNVPKLHGNGGSRNLTNNNVYMPHYYTTTAAGRPAWDDPHALVEISNTRNVDMDGAARNPAMTYPGGPARTDCVNPAACTYAEEIQNFANWFSYYRSREYTAKAALGRTVADVSNVRIGYVVLNDTNERIAITSMNSSFRVGAKRALMNQVYKIDSNNGTPLRAALDRAGKHFECRSGDSFGSTSNTAPGNVRCPVSPSPEGQCQNNFALLFSDGTWNENFNTANQDGNNNTPFDGGKYADTIGSTLADVAMNYYERDLHPTLLNGVPTTLRDTKGAAFGAFGADDEVMHQHMKTFTVALGLRGLIDPSSVPTVFSDPFPWGNPFNDGPSKVDDMMHAAVNGRGEFLQANDPVVLSAALQSAFQEFTDGSVSVSAVAFNSTALREQTVEYRGFFNLKYNTGDLRALNVNATTGFVDNASPIWRAAARLDAQAPTNRVIFTYDRINDAGVPFRFASLNADQRIVLDTNEVDYIRGSRTLEEPAGSFRQRPLVEGLLGDIVHSAPQFVGAPRAIRRDQSPYPLTKLYSAFKDANAARSPMVYVAANDGMVHGFDALVGIENMAYVPNKLIDGSQRFRNALDQVASLSYSHKFFVDVTPTLEDVFMPPRKGALANDWTTVLVGALGGGGKGYYALNVSNPVVDFASESNASNTVLWEFTDADDEYPVDATGTPLGGAVGALVDLGGSPIKDLGYTYSPAQVFMTNLNDGGSPAQKKWAAIFGNGYNSTAGIAKLFVIPLAAGLDGWQAGDVLKIDTGEGVKVAPDVLAGLPNGLGTPTLVDVDLNGTADVAYAGDLFGNLFRFNIANSNPSLWGKTKLFQATYGLKRQPITTQPYVIKHPTQPGFVVIFGTGSYVTEADGTSTEIQSVYGIWDRGELNPATADPLAKSTRLVQQVVTNIVDETNATFDHLRIVSANPVDYRPDAGLVPGVYGWYFDFKMTRPMMTLQGNANPDSEGNAPPAVQYPGERAIRRFVPRGSALLITSVIPRDANTCFRSPPGSTFPIDALTGGNPTRAILDLNNDGVIDDMDFVTVGGVNYAAGILFDTSDLNGQLVDPSLLLGSGDGDFLFLSGGDEQITIRVAGAEDSKTGRLSWRELNNAN